MKKILFIVLSGIMFHAQSYAQIAVPVSLQTGAPYVSVPIYEIRNGDVSVPISLYYTPGVKPSQPNGNDEYNIGVGWSLSAGGKISRAVKSLPDDYLGTGTDTRKGWLYGTGAAAVASFTPQSRTNCSGDVANYNMLNSMVNSNADTEPDVYNFSFPGGSGQFMFDNNKVIQTLPYQDLKIVPTYAANGAIASFTITANNGFVYTFYPTTTINETITSQGTANTEYYLRDKVIKYAQSISYTTVWSLSLISSSGGAVSLGYANQVPIDSVLTNPPPTDIYLAGAKKTIFYTRAIINTNTLSSISENAPFYAPTNPGYESISFNYQSSHLSDFKVTAANTPDKTISLNIINTVGYNFLQSVRPYSSGCTISPPYEFEYLGTVLGLSTTLTSPSGKEQDYWGYFNGNQATTLVPNLYMYPNEPMQERYRLQQIPNYVGTYNSLSSGADRTVNSAVITAGSLRRIIYPTGGSIKMDYEPNQYFDARANHTFYGGGIRVKTVTMHDGVNTTNDIVKNYTYSGGVLLNRPQFAFPVPVYTDNNGVVHTISEYTDQPTQANNFTARTEGDLNQYDFNSPNVMYQSGTESQTGKGKIVSQYLNPATYGQTTSPEYSAPNQWQATSSQYATTSNPSTGVCMSQGMMADGYYSFPFPTNPNYNFERGLLQNTQVYNETGQLLKRTDYQYTPIYQNTAPVSIYGLAYDYFTYSASDINTKAFAYGKYRLFAAMNKYQASTTETTYDPGTNYTTSTSVKTDNFYNSPNHRMLSSTSTATSSDGVNFTTYKKKYTYPQDYTATANTDPATAGILALKNSYMNNTVIEQLSSIIKPGQSEMVTGAQLNKFNVFSVLDARFSNTQQTFTTKIAPAQVLALRTNTPLSLSNFLVSTINNNVFQYDNRYQVGNNVFEYSAAGLPVSMDDGHQRTATTLYDYSGVKPIASISNALASQVVYSNFDDDLPIITKPHSFGAAINLTFGVVPGRIGSGLSISPNYLFSKSAVSKGPGSYYVFSCWINNPTTTAGTMTVTLTDGTHNSSGTINYSSTTGVWSYYRLRLPVSSLNPTFSINVQTGNLPLWVDDMLLRPELAQGTLTGYKNKLKIADTDPHGNTTFYAYDALDRSTSVTDQNQNIIKQLTYNYRSAYTLYAGFYYSVPPGGGSLYADGVPTTVNVNTPVAFRNGYPDPCEPAGILRNWDFGDGTMLSNGGATPSHTYTASGIYTVKLTVTSPLYGTVTSTRTFTVVTPLAFTLHCAGVTGYNVCSQQIMGYGDLGPGTNPLGTNTFTATVSGSYTNQFRWEMAYTNAPNTWITVPGTSNTVTVTVFGGIYGPASSSKAYTMRCTMLPQALQTAAVNWIGLSFFAPNCPL